MLGRAGTGAKKASKFEDSDSSSHTSRPRAMSDLPHRPAPRVPTRPRTATLAAGSEVHGARHRGVGVARGTAPRSPLQEKKPAGAVSGAGAGSRAAELEVKLGKAHDQLAAMREQLAAAEKARKEARGVFAEAKKRFAARKRDVAAPARDEVEHDNNVRPPEHKQQQQEAEVATADVVNGDSEERRGIMDSENNGSQVEEEDAEKKTTDNGDEVNRNNNIAVVGDDGGGSNKGNPEADQLWTKLMAKDREVYELRAKLMLRDMEVDELKAELTAKDANIGTLMAELVAKDAEFAALRAENVELTQTASEAAEVERKTTASKAREAERALMDSAAREARLAERLRESERAREALEAEARCSRVQSGQWRKAAEEAAAVLGGAGHQVCARGAEETEEDKLRDAGDEGSSGKRKPAGGAVRLLADLWKKRASK
uniref:Uncharacterized protein n=1 Tax=Hordeum vulgare subsp. vulgare TaxID=112509 RepID=A0A8I6WIA1_HORVV